MATGARVVVHGPAVPVLRDYGVLGFVVVRVLAFILSVPRKTDYGFRVSHVPIFLLSRVTGVEVALEIFRVTNDAIPIVLLVRQGAQRAVVELVVRRRAVVEGERLVRARVPADVGEPVRGQRAAAAGAASRALRPSARALAAGHEEHARGGVKL